MIDLHLSEFAPRWRFLYVVRIDAYAFSPFYHAFAKKQCLRGLNSRGREKKEKTRKACLSFCQVASFRIFLFLTKPMRNTEGALESRSSGTSAL